MEATWGLMVAVFMAVFMSAGGKKTRTIPPLVLQSYESNTRTHKLGCTNWCWPIRFHFGVFQFSWVKWAPWCWSIHKHSFSTFDQPCWSALLMKNLEWYISPQGFPQLKNPHLKCANPSISLDQSFLIWGFQFSWSNGLLNVNQFIIIHFPPVINQCLYALLMKVFFRVCLAIN